MNNDIVVAHTANLPAEVQATLRKNAEDVGKRIAAPSGDLIKLTKKKTFVLPGGQESEGPLKVVVLDFATYHAYYDRPWTEGDAERSAPACFALAKQPVGIAPSDKSPDKQNDTCKGCWADDFKSHANGKAKACRQHRLLAVVEPSDDPNAPIMLLRVPPKSIKHWDKHVADLQLRQGGAEFGPIAFTTEVWFDQGPDYQMIKFGNPEDNLNIGVHALRQAAATKRLLTEPDVSAYTPPPAKKGPPDKKK